MLFRKPKLSLAILISDLNAILKAEIAPWSFWFQIWMLIWNLVKAPFGYLGYAALQIWILASFLLTTWQVHLSTIWYTCSLTSETLRDLIMRNWFNQWVKMPVASSHCRVHAVPDYEGKGQYVMMNNSHIKNAITRTACIVIIWFAYLDTWGSYRSLVLVMKISS